MNSQNRVGGRSLAQKATPSKSDLVKFSETHYLPILKTKLGEFQALKALSLETKTNVTPVFEVTKPGPRYQTNKASGKPEKLPPIPLPQHVEKVVRKMKNCWGRRMFVDTKALGIGNEGAAQLKSVLSNPALSSLVVVPVTRLEASSAFQKMVASFASNQNTGAMIRVKPGHWSGSQLEELRLQLGLPYGEVDILVDFGSAHSSQSLPAEMRDSILALPTLGKWRTVTVAGTSAPKSINGLTADSWHLLPRHEWVAYKQLHGGAVPRVPTFGDYGIRDDSESPDFGNPKPGIRYTTDENFLVNHGPTTVLEGGSPDIVPILQSLIKRPEYDGPDFSEGDAEIMEVATHPDGGKGNSTSWIKWGMNHHIEKVVDEIQSLNAA